MRIYDMGSITVIGVCLAMATSTTAYAEVKSHSVKGTATTEQYACEAAIRSAKIGWKEGELISISPCRCAKKPRSNYYECVVDVTYEMKD